MRDKEIVEKIKNVVKLLDEIDEMIKTQSQELQAVDYELSDLYHLIENNDLDEKVSFNIVKRIHELRKKRRALNNENELENTYQTHKSKLSGSETRQFLMAEINKTSKRLGCEYKNRVLTEEDINTLFETKRTKRGRPKKEI